MKTTIKYLLVLVLAGFVFAGCTTTINGSCKAKQWEYKTTTCQYQTLDQFEYLNKLGKEGWVLVSVTHVASVNQFIYIFKRPKQ